MSSKEPQYGTGELLRLLSIDVAVGGLAAVSVSPFVAAIDKGITQNLAGTAKLGDSLRASFKEMGPSFLISPTCRWLVLVYGATYMTANVANTLCEYKGVDPKMPVLVSTVAVNTTTCIAKDRAFARMFGAIKPAPVPALTYALWLTRDSIVMGAAFTLPPVLSSWMQERFHLAEVRAGYFAQLLTPAASQFAVTFFHLAGLDVYNRGSATLTERMALIKAEYLKSVGARIIRGIVPYTVGAVLNKDLRKALR